MTTTSASPETVQCKSSGEMKWICWAESAPASPASAPERPKAFALCSQAESPRARIRASLARMPTSVRPKPERSSQAAAT